MRTIHLHMDAEFFAKLKIAKAELEAKMGSITWEDYVKYLFGVKRGKK